MHPASNTETGECPKENEGKSNLGRFAFNYRVSFIHLFSEEKKKNPSVWEAETLH